MIIVPHRARPNVRSHHPRSHRHHRLPRRDHPLLSQHAGRPRAGISILIQTALPLASTVAVSDRGLYRPGCLRGRCHERSESLGAIQQKKGRLQSDDSEAASVCARDNRRNAAAPHGANENLASLDYGSMTARLDRLSHAHHLISGDTAHFGCQAENCESLKDGEPVGIRTRDPWARTPSRSTTSRHLYRRQASPLTR